MLYREETTTYHNSKMKHTNIVHRQKAQLFNVKQHGALCKH